MATHVGSTKVLRWRMAFRAAAVVLMGSIPLSAHAQPSAELTSLTVPARVAPGASLPVTAELLIARADPTDVTLVFTGDTSWKHATLTYSSTVSADGGGTTARYTGTLGAPTQVGIHALTWRPSSAGVPIGASIASEAEVTCSNGAFCDGPEHYVNGRCVTGSPPCDDGEACTTDVCDETTGTCSHALDLPCAACTTNCTPHCNGKTCGSDGCGGSCGTCFAGEACVDGACTFATTPGTCANPIPLLAPDEPFFGEHIVTGDTTNAIEETFPVCNLQSSPEQKFVFFVPSVTGIDARATGFDTVLSIVNATCFGSTVACNDDGNPPGGAGSRVSALLQPGQYFLVIDGYDATQRGPFTLDVRLVAGCVPQCEGKYCGDDGCGGSCGSCPAPSACSAEARCVASPCVPSCNGRKCGDDGCGGSCGTCGAGSLCFDGSCLKVPACNYDLPSCKSCGNQKYCGTDCTCHAASKAAPDLVPDPTFGSSFWIEDRSVPPGSCDFARGCVAAPGMRRLLHFSQSAVNQGFEDLVVPALRSRPDLYETDVCTNQPALRAVLTEVALSTLDGQTVRIARPRTSCVADTSQASTGPATACTAQFDCTTQGIQAGWKADLTTKSTSCAFLDITGVAPDSYNVTLTVNPDRAFDETSYDNNSMTVPIVIP